jgi:glycosyltransferase involved in cell wall biosynthesis
MKPKLVSVIIPAYNAGKYIKEAIDSALAQTYKNIEIIVVDDGSTDNTRNIAASYNTPRVRLITHEDNKNHGMCKSRYLGYKNSRGAYIAFLDADDIFLPEKIEKQSRFLEKSGAALTHCKAILQNETRVPYTWNFSMGMKAKQYNLIKDTDYLIRNNICNSSALIRSEALKQVDFDIEKLSGVEDWYIWVSLSAQTKKDFLYTPEPLLKHRFTQGCWTFRVFESELLQLQARLEFLLSLKAHIQDPAVLEDVDKEISKTRESIKIT